MKKIFLLGLLGLLISCSPVKRFNKLIRKHPELIETKYKTYYDTVTVVVNGVKTDTIVHREVLKDTLVLKKEQLKVVIYEKGDSVYVEGECDTVYVDKEVEVEVPVYYYKQDRTFLEGIKFYLKVTMWLIAIIILIALLAKWLKRVKDKTPGI